MGGGEVEESQLLRRSICLQCFVCPTLCVHAATPHDTLSDASLYDMYPPPQMTCILILI
jgi:hypothetical protein